MLTKRTNILFDKELWNTLSSLSQKRGVSIGKLVRDAVRDTYSDEKHIADSRKKAIEMIKKIRPKPARGKINYKELINEGRKY